MSAFDISLVRLRAPYSATMKFVDDQPTVLPPRSLPFAQRKRTALHEAAHAIAAKSYGVPIRFIEIGIGIGTTPLGSVGRVIYAVNARDVQLGLVSDAALWAHIVIALAGPIADTFFCNTSDNGTRGDFKQAYQCAEQIDPQNSGEVIRQAWAAAEKIVRNNRTVISCLAAILEHSGKLSGTAIDGIIGGISFTGKVRPGPLQPRGGGYQIRSTPCP